MIIDWENELIRGAEARCQEDEANREARQKQVDQVRRRERRGRRRTDWEGIDESKRIIARAKLLGLYDDLVEADLRDEGALLERILKGRDLLSSDFLNMGARVASAVGRVHVRDQRRRARGFGTGFMISHRLMMTNNHVLDDAGDCRFSAIEFDYVEGLVDARRLSSFYGLDAGTFFVTSRLLDYTIVALAPEYDERQAQRRGWLPMIAESGKLVVGERVNILQHPRGGPQEVGLRQNRLEGVVGDFLHYGTDTEPGSSGSPVCNDQWQLAALHHAGVPDRNAQGEVIGWKANEGVRISSIYRDLQERLQNADGRMRDLFEAAQVVPPSATGESFPATPAVPTGGMEIPLTLRIRLDSGDAVSSAPISPAPPPGPPTPAFEPPAGARFVQPPRDAPAYSNPILECIITRFLPGVDSKAAVDDLARGWSLEPTDPERRPYSFYLLPPAPAIEPPEAWEMVYRLRVDDRVAQAEPSWAIDQVMETPRESETREGFLWWKTKADKAAEVKTWAPDLIGAREAWKVAPPAGGMTHGERIHIAHPDSGYTLHPELWERPNTLDLASGYDYVDDDSMALDMDGFHGTGTASVLISGVSRDIVGVAPRATLVPMRVSQKGWIRPSPVIWRAGTRHLAKAILRAIEKNCHVISISLGWFGNSALHDAVKKAWENDLIVVAAAGNYTGPFIVWPSRYSESICMAGCDAARGIWEGSARGRRVDFTGPAQDVWKAGFEGGLPEVMHSSGTSFATAMTAGVAALWLAFHGRQKLIDKYRPKGVRLAEVFRTVLRQSCDEPPGSLLGGFGGIVNAERALQTPLPDPVDVRWSLETEALEAADDPVTSDAGRGLAYALQMMGEDPARERRYLSEMLDVPETALAEIADGCGDEMAFHAVLNRANPRSGELEGFAASSVDRGGMSGRLRGKVEKAKKISH